jgi:hypothetical protein
LSTEDYRDEVFALFQAIWHLKDWIIKSDSTLASKVEPWIQKEGHSLKVAADVANGSKHMVLDRHPRAGGSAHTRNDAFVVTGVSPPQTFKVVDRSGPQEVVRQAVATVTMGLAAKHTFYLVDRSGPQEVEWEAVALADECLEEWRRFLQDQKVPIPATHQ